MLSKLGLGLVSGALKDVDSVNENPLPVLCPCHHNDVQSDECNETPDLRRCVHFGCSIVDGGNKLEVCFLLHL